MAQLEIGDKIRLESPFYKYTVEIARVTKTKAISKPINNAGACVEFKREYSDPQSIRPFASVKWDTTYRILIQSKEGEV